MHASTGFTPYRVMFAQEMVLPVDVMLNLDGNERFSSVNAYVEKITESLSTVVEAVKKHQSKAKV